jgi:hypothetical protein
MLLAFGMIRKFCIVRTKFGVECFGFPEGP